MTAALTVQLPAEPAVVPRLQAEPSSILAFADQVLAASSQVDDVSGFARRHRLDEMWQGAAAEAYRSRLPGYTYRTDAVSLTLREVARRAEQHGRRVDRQLRTRESLDAERGELVTAIRQLRAEVDAAGGPGVDPEQLRQLVEAPQQRADRLGQRVRTHETDVATWVAEVEEEQREMAGVLARLSTVEQAVGRYGGVDDPADEPLSRMPEASASPAAVAAWWRSLTPAQRDAVMAAEPGVIGNRDGIPVADRDRANRNVMARDGAYYDHLHELGVITDDEERIRDNVHAAEDALDGYDGRVDAAGRVVPAFVHTYEPGAFGGDGRIAIALNDPDTADHVAVNVPGIGTEADDIGTYTDRAWNLLQSSTTADPDAVTSSIVWIGYDAPAGDTTVDKVTGGAAVEARAEAGAERLADAVDGLNATHHGDPDHTVIGHSYGSTTVGATLNDHEVSVDQVAVVGSPGLTGDVESVGDLGLDEDQFFVGRNHDDGVARLGQNGWLGFDTLNGSGLGHDPSDSGFGGTRFQANAAEGDDDHSSYYEPDSESLHNLGQVVVGGDPTTAEPVHDPLLGTAHDPEEDAPSDLHDTDGDQDADGNDPSARLEGYDRRLS